MLAVSLVAGLLGCATSTPTSSTAPSSSTGNPFRIGRPLVIPHGGGDGLFPEDTLYAYEHSIALGGDVIDADVQVTADGVPIAFHDATFVTTQLVSQPEFVASDGTRRITSDYLAFSHSKNIAVLTWTVDDPADMTKLIKLGVDGIYTRRPDVMVKLLKDMGMM